jgi:hypothetical protein
MTDTPEGPGSPDSLIELVVSSIQRSEQPVWTKLLTVEIQARAPELGLHASKVHFPEIVLPSFDRKVPKIDFDHFFRTSEEAIQQLATRGWSLPWGLNLPDMQELAEKNPDEIDAFFEEYFQDGALGKLQVDILRDRKLERWNLLLTQCFKNYANGDFQICVPSLIIVLEGSFNYLSFFKVAHRKKFFDERIEAAVGFQKMTWISLRAFCEVVFMPGDPRRITDYINRHKVMHGLDDPSQWKKIDCLRLFQALDSTRRIK